MPSVSKSQQRLMQAAEHGADFPMAKKVRASMTHEQMHDFAVGSEKHKPEHVKPPRATQYGKHAKTISHQQPGHMRHFGGRG